MRREAMVCITTVAFTLTILVAQRTATQYQWDLPPGVPPPRLPVDTPMTAERVELGRYLFYDTRLSGNGTQSCATCHIQALAFTDGRSRAVGSTGERHPRPTGTRPASKNWSRPDTSRWPWPRSSGRSSPSGRPTTATGSATTRARSHRRPAGWGSSSPVGLDAEVVI